MYQDVEGGGWHKKFGEGLEQLDGETSGEDSFSDSKGAFELHPIVLIGPVEQLSVSSRRRKFYLLCNAMGGEFCKSFEVTKAQYG